MVYFIYLIRKYCLSEQNRTKYDELFNKLIRKYYFLTNRKNLGVSKNNRRKLPLIISLTSIPSRIDIVWMTIESLLRQTYRPDKILLWLSEEEFKEIKLPQKLLEQQARGLEIRYCDNLKSYKKFYNTFQEYPKSLVVTVDDDIIYSEKMVDGLVKAYCKNRNSIACHRVHKIKTTSEGKIGRYNLWEMHNEHTYKKGILEKGFFTSGGGALFPVSKLNKEILNRDVFMKLAPYADDIWLNVMVRISGLNVYFTDEASGYVLLASNSQEQCLWLQNIVGKQNDIQLRAVLEHYKLTNM